MLWQGALVVHDWNRANFEALKSVSNALRADPRLERLAAYCDLRERGQRRQAFVQLEAFLHEAGSRDGRTQRELAVLVLEAHLQAPQAHQFMAAPLREQFLGPVFEQWRADEAGDPVPLRSLSLLRRDRELLEAALIALPADDRVRACLAELFLEDVEYATHHASAGVLIGDQNEASALLARTASILEGVADEASVQALRQRVGEQAELLGGLHDRRDEPDGARGGT